MSIIRNGLYLGGLILLVHWVWSTVWPGANLGVVLIGTLALWMGWHVLCSAVYLICISAAEGVRQWRRDRLRKRSYWE